VVLSIAVSFAPAVILARRAGSSTAEFFTSGRSAPWWLIGVSMVATTFSTDTPNLVTNLVREHGVANNWQWWAFLLTGMMTVFFYARLWRRSGVLTDLEFYNIRYSGKPATFVRGFRAVYLGLAFNCFIMASVNLAAVKIARPRIPVYANVSAKPLTDPEEIRAALATQICSPVLWEDTIRAIAAPKYVELGPGRVLAGLVRKIDDKAEVVSIEGAAS